MIKEEFSKASKVYGNLKHDEKKHYLKKLFEKSAPKQGTEMEKANSENLPSTSKSRKKNQALVKRVIILLSPNNCLVQSRCLEWFRAISHPGITLRWLCSAVCAVGVLNLLHNILLFDVEPETSNIPVEVWQVISPKLSCLFGITGNKSSEKAIQKIALPFFPPSQNSPEKDEISHVKITFICRSHSCTWMNRNECAAHIQQLGFAISDNAGGKEKVTKTYGLNFQRQISLHLTHDAKFIGQTANIKDGAFAVHISSATSDASSASENIQVQMTSLYDHPLPKLFSTVSEFLTSNITESIASL